MIRLPTLALSRCLRSRAVRPQLRLFSDVNNNVWGKKKRVAVAMSGGVDSAACAYLLQKEGYDCVGVFMRNWDSSDEEGGNSACTLSQDLTDMQQVCARLDIPTIEVDFMKEYWHDVFVGEIRTSFDTQYCCCFLIACCLLTWQLLPGDQSCSREESKESCYSPSPAIAPAKRHCSCDV